MESTSKLTRIYETLRLHHGAQHWWPAQTPFEVMVGAILTQNTSWTNVEKAIDNLRELGALEPQRILQLETAELELAIRPSGYYRQKAGRLKLFCRAMMEDFGGQVEKMKDVKTPRLREWLLRLKGIGPETADSILLYALGRAAFVIDAYTIRLFSRVGHLPAGAAYEMAQELFTADLEPEAALFNEYHALIVMHAKTVCRKNDPRCGDCVLKSRCRHGLTVNAAAPYHHGP